MRDWKSTFGVLLVFVLGCLAGAFVAFIVVHHRVVDLLRPGSPAYEQMLERRLSRGLHMDNGQRERFHDALADNIDARRKLQSTLQPQMQELNEQTRQQMRSILTEEQLVTLRHNMQEFRQRFGAPGLGGRALDETAGDTNSSPIGTNTPIAPN